MTGVLVVDVLRQLQDTIWLTTQTSHGSGIVQGVTSNGQPVNTPEADGRLLADVSLDDSLPGESVQSVYKQPHPDNGDEPIASMAEMFPQLDETDVKRNEHHHHGNHTEEEKKIVDALLSPFHHVL